MRALRVLNCITGLNIGGAEYMLLRYLRQIDRQRFDPSVLSLMRPGPLQQPIADLNVPVSNAGMSQSRPSISGFQNLRLAFKTNRPDIVHGWMYHGNIAASIGSMMDAKQPVIWGVHHSLDDIKTEKPMSRWLIRLSARLSKGTSAISYCSRVSADQHELIGFDASKRCIIPNGTDCDEFRPDPGARSRLGAILGIPPDRILIGNISRTHPMKDHGNLVRAISILLQEGLNVQGLFIGAGHEDGLVRQMASELGINERISTLGPRNDIQSIMPGLDIYALSSAWGEAFPLAVSEAMACGIPPVATSLGDCGWLIGDETRIVPPRNPQALAAILRKLVTLSAEERTALGLHGRNRIIENFSLKSYLAQHRTLYEQIIDQGRHKPMGSELDGVQS